MGIAGRPVAAWIALAAVLPLLAGLAGALWLRGQGGDAGLAAALWFAVCAAAAAWSAQAEWRRSRWQLVSAGTGFTLDGQAVELRVAAAFFGGMLLMATPKRGAAAIRRVRWLAIAPPHDAESRHRLHGLRLALAHALAQAHEQAGSEPTPAR
jgi:hypothetical protein